MRFQSVLGIVLCDYSLLCYKWLKSAKKWQRKDLYILYYYILKSWFI